MPLTLTEHSVIGGAQFYLIIVSEDGLTLNCIARYSEILEFREKHPNLTDYPFPPKLFPFIAPSPSELSYRRTQLEEWMKSAYENNRKVVQNFVQHQHQKHQNKMVATPTTVAPSSSPSASPFSSPDSSTGVISVAPQAPLFDSSVYCELLPDDGKTRMYITDMTDVRRYEPSKQKFVSLASGCRLRNKLYHRPLCIYGLDSQELVVYFTPWERIVSLGLLIDFMGTTEKLQLRDDCYRTLLLGDKYYLLYQQYFLCIDVTTLTCEHLPYPPQYRPSKDVLTGGFPLFVGTGKRIHLINKDPKHFQRNEQEAKSHEIFDTENKVWTQARYPKQFDGNMIGLPRAVFMQGVLYAFSSKISVCYFPQTDQWENLPVPPVKDSPLFHLTYDPATFEIWFFDGRELYTFNPTSKIWTNHPDIPLVDQKKSIAKIGTLFFSSTFENGNVQKLEDQMSFIISRAPTPWKDLYRQDKINDSEENLITQFEQCPLSEKIMLFKKSSEYLPLFAHLFKKRIGFERVCELVWQMCREEPSLTFVIYEHITEPYWTQAFTVPVGNSFTFITKKQREEVTQNRAAAAQQQALRQREIAAAQQQNIVQQQIPPPSAPAMEELPPAFTPEMEASLIELSEKTAKIMQALESKFVVPPQEFICPITQQIMWDPVTTRDGHNYERLAILQWFSRGNRKSPLTNQELADYSLMVPFSLKTLIQDFLQKNGVSE